MAVLDPLVYGILLGGLFTLISVGFSLSWGVLDIIDLSHGIQIILGSYISFWLYTLYGINYWLTIPVAFALIFAGSYVYQRTLLQRFVDREQFIYIFVITFGVSVACEALMDIFWTSNYRSVTMDYPTFVVGGVTIPSLRIIAFVVSIVLTGLLAYMLKYTRMGYAIRAIRDNQKSARLMGVNTDRTYALTMGLKGGLAAVGGSLLLTLQPISPISHFRWMVFAFIVVVIGGLGSVTGALAGGLLLGVVISAVGTYASQGIADVVAYTLLTVFLFVRPTGLFGLQEGQSNA
ncbi:MAG: branched-chain amino acid ABC transporter permease [Halorientalis sp.]